MAITTRPDNTLTEKGDTDWYKDKAPDLIINRLIKKDKALDLMINRLIKRQGR